MIRRPHPKPSLVVSGKYAFRVSFLSGDKGMSHTLVAHDEHDRRQWVTALRSVLPEAHVGSENIKRLRRGRLSQHHGGDTASYNSDVSIDSGVTSSSMSSSLVKRSGSSASDRVVSIQEGIAVKRTGSSVSDNQVVYRDYPSLRVLGSPRQNLFNIPDDDSEVDTSMRAKRRRSGGSGVASSANERKQALLNGRGRVLRKRAMPVSTVTRPSVSEQSDTDESFCTTATQGSFGWDASHEIDLDDDITDSKLCVRGNSDVEGPVP